MLDGSRWVVERGAWACALTLLLSGCSGTALPTPPAPQSPRHSARSQRAEASFLGIAQPSLPPDASCAQARAAYVEGWNLDRAIAQPDLTEGHYGSVLARGHYLESCSVPESYEVSICAAVQNGQVLGASVATSPRAPRLERCIAQGVRSLSFPTHPRMDVTRTIFAAAH